MGKGSTSSFILLLLTLPSLHSIDIGIGGGSGDGTIGIGIGGGGGGAGGGGSGLPPPQTPAPAEPQPCDFPNEKQFEAYKVIQRFKKTITCDPNGITKSWSGNRPCTYHGFYCDTPPGLTKTPTIASVDFNGLRLAAPSLAGFLDELPDLALFHANSNAFSGTVPDLSSLPFLYELDVSNNQLSGGFPASVLRIRNLTFLDIRFNRFAGSVPGFIFTLRLNYLFINNNRFDQPIAADFGKSKVRYLTLANNGFTGPIPASISNASDTLIEVLFLNNKLSGCLPAGIGNLKKATVFDAGFNELTGPIPFSFACLLNVEQLNLAVNRLYGEVPDTLCRLAFAGKLLNLSLSHNYFTKLGPLCRTLIKKGVLDVRRNCVPGLSDQRSPAECADFLAHCPVCPLTDHMTCMSPPSLTRNDDVVLPARSSYSALMPGIN
ncbi:uncharacterized protein At4g06744-like [Phalaenopsis equestris]|uniref:uncharacterized protein At4g06744-like n=1 Tax=Phalaenopsis equestris TaxID=78828 RepID=UPI0009E35CD8|nr:uncharacterized protein At4g06744-like [Phalaenopsis equestris]